MKFSVYIVRLRYYDFVELYNLRSKDVVSYIYFECEGQKYIIIVGNKNFNLSLSDQSFEFISPSFVYGLLDLDYKIIHIHSISHKLILDIVDLEIAGLVTGTPFHWDIFNNDQFVDNFLEGSNSIFNAFVKENFNDYIKFVEDPTLLLGFLDRRVNRPPLEGGV